MSVIALILCMCVSALVIIYNDCRLTVKNEEGLKLHEWCCLMTFEEGLNL